MEFQIVGAKPRPDTVAAIEHDHVGRTDTGSAAALRYTAQHSLADVDALIAGADAAGRCGTWQPGGAANKRDFCALAAAEDVLRRQRKRQRR